MIPHLLGEREIINRALLPRWRLNFTDSATVWQGNDSMLALYGVIFVWGVLSWLAAFFLSVCAAFIYLFMALGGMIGFYLYGIAVCFWFRWCDLFLLITFYGVKYCV